MSIFIFDIETGPLPLDQILANADPFPPYEDPGEFDPASVKLGNLKDQQKIAEKVQAKAEEHNEMRAKSHGKWEQDKAAYEAGLVDKAALSALTGQVLAIGYLNPQLESPSHIEMQGEGCTEEILLKRFWARWEKSQASARPDVGDYRTTAASLWVGYNIAGFDLPFLCQRSWILGVKVPSTVRQGVGRLFWHNGFVDLMERWTCGSYGKFAKLGHVSTALGCGEKDGDGAEFARLWKEEPDKARAYLANDLEMTLGVAQGLGVL